MPWLQIEVSFIDNRKIRRCLEHGYIFTAVGHKGIYRSFEFLFGRRIITVRHTDIPEHVFVPGSRDQRFRRQLHIVVVGPLGDDLEFLLFRVVIHFELPSAKLSGLKGHPFDEAAYFVLIGIERNVGIGEIPDRKRRAVIACALFGPYGTDRTDPARIYRIERFLLEIFDDTEVGILFDVLRPVGQLQPGISVPIRIDVAGGAYREEPSEKFHAIGHAPFDSSGQSVAVRQRDRLAELTAGYVERHPVEPPLRPGGRRQFRKSIGGVLSRIFDIDVLRYDHFSDFPFGRPHFAVHVSDNQRRMFACRCRECQNRIVVIIRIDHQDLRGESFDPRQLHRIAPLAVAVHLRLITFENPITPSEEVRIIVNFERDAFEGREGEREDTLLLYAAGCSTVTIGRGRQLQIPFFRIYFEFHFLKI